jgi:hypothetical protein
MDNTDYIIDSSNSEEDMIRSVTDLARKTHGNEAVDSLLELSPDEESFKRDIVGLSRQKKIEEPTMEETLGFNRVYKAADVAGKVIGPFIKPVTTPIAGVLETINEGPSAGLSAMGEDLTQLSPSPKSSFAYQLGKYKELNKPIMNTPIETLKEDTSKFDMFSPKTRAAAKLWLQKEFPQTYGFVSNASPATLIGGSLDMLTGESLANASSSAVKNIAGKVGDISTEASFNSAEKAIERMSSISGEKASEASNTLKTRKSAMTAAEYGLTDSLSNPTELTEKLNGSRGILPDDLTGKKSVKTKTGLIDALTNHVNSIADDLGSEVEPINTKKIEEDVFKSIETKLSDINSGATWNPEIAGSVKKTVNSFFKNTPYSLEDIASEVRNGNFDNAMDMQNNYNKSNKRDFRSLIKLKRAAADKVFEINKNPEIFGVEGATNKAIFKEIWDQIDNKVNSLASSEVPGVSDFVKYNSDLSDMLHLKNMTQNARVEGLSTLSIPEMVAGTAATTTAASMFGHPLAGLAYAPARAAMKMGETNIPAYLAPMQESLAKGAYSTMLGENSLSKAPGRSVGLSIASAARPNIEQFRIPRNTQSVMQNQDMVYAKVKMVLGSRASDALNNATSSKHVSDLLSTYVQARPDMFEESQYNSFDGVILDPMMRQKAISDLVKNPGSSIQDAKKMEKLIHDGIDPTIQQGN